MVYTRKSHFMQYKPIIHYSRAWKIRILLVLLQPSFRVGAKVHGEICFNMDYFSFLSDRQRRLKT